MDATLPRLTDAQRAEPKFGRREPEAIPRDEIGVVAQS
jgi:hypothetical protein